MPSTRPLLLAAALGAALAAPALATAQSAVGAPSAGQQRIRLTPGQALARYQGARKAQLAQMHALLKITPAQQGAWNDFVRDTTMTIDDFAPPTMPATTPERVDAIDAYAQARLDATKRRNRAVKAFYEKLSPEQKATMDGRGPRSGGRPLPASPTV